MVKVIMLACRIVDVYYFIDSHWLIVAALIHCVSKKFPHFYSL